MEACKAGRSTNIFCNALAPNKDREDGKQLGAASAVLYYEERELGHTEKSFGEAVTEADAMTSALTPGLITLTLFLATKSASFQTLAVFLISSVPSNLVRVRDINSDSKKSQVTPSTSSLKASSFNVSFQRSTLNAQ